ncbi:MAG: 2-oxoacid:ferredoxin oxidoreductase subunit beta [bacterium]|nr:2-oxoacid:ferredoxin oxidoreductase subunit beta [bacterium]
MTAVSQTTETRGAGVKLNRLGLAQSDYKGLPSTLCAGCGHDAVTGQIIRTFWEMGVEPWRVAKMSGIGCSSKSTAYFLNQAHAFNGVHGRMATLATGSHLANRSLIHIGLSGDGDTASIGLGNFLHMLRRNVPMVYIVENNGVYGLTKGQFSATADKGSKLKSGRVNTMEPIDCCALAIEMGCQFVARSFSGDFAQLNPLIKAALSHNGTALLDVVSPCMTFNNHEGSTKSLAYAKAHEDPLHEIGFIPESEQTVITYEPGEVKTIELTDGSRVSLKKLGRDYDPTDKAAALSLLDEARRNQLFLTGMIYHNTEYPTIDEDLELIDQPLATLPESVTRPSAEVLRRIVDGWK